jgi:Flp pilus assembly protein TadD
MSGSGVATGRFNLLLGLTLYHRKDGFARIASARGHLVTGGCVMRNGRQTAFRRSLGGRRRLRLGLIGAALALGLAGGGCMTRGGDVTGSLQRTPQLSQGEWRQRAEGLAGRYQANPNDRNTAFSYATALRGAGQIAQATAVLQKAVLAHPRDLEMLGLYGRALADSGKLKEAQDVLERAHTPDRPDWRILSVQGTVADQLGDHDTARLYYEAALKIVPGEPTVLSNLGLSLALTRRLTEAEQVLRQAAAHPQADARVRQNLVLVLGLQGKFAEAERVAAQDQSPQQVAATIADLKKMVGQQNSWDMLKRGGKPASAEKPRRAQAATSRPPA